LFRSLQERLRKKQGQVIMESIKFEIVTLNWIEADFKLFPSTPGLYQIYGDSPLYGKDTLLYIGQAMNLKHRSYSHFTSERSFIGRQPNKTCRYAELDDELLDLVEQTLIVMHKPSFNSCNIIDVGPEIKASPIYIQNHGERGMLNLEVTNFYFLPAPERQETITAYNNSGLDESGGK
jgi:hypothetical protein